MCDNLSTSTRDKVLTCKRVFLVNADSETFPLETISYLYCLVDWARRAADHHVVFIVASCNDNILQPRFSHHEIRSFENDIGWRQCREIVQNRVLFSVFGYYTLGRGPKSNQFLKLHSLFNMWKSSAATGRRPLLSRVERGKKGLKPQQTIAACS